MALPLAYALMKPLFTPLKDLRHDHMLGDDQKLPLPPELPARLSAGRCDDALTLALRRLRASGLTSPFPPGRVTAGGLAGERLLAALLVPLGRAGRAHLYKTAGLVPNDDLPLETGA